MPFATPKPDGHSQNKRKELISLKLLLAGDSGYIAMTSKIWNWVLCLLLVVLAGCGRKNIKYGYIIFHNNVVVASGKMWTPNQMTNDEKWKSLEGLELQATYVKGGCFNLSLMTMPVE